VIRGPTILPVYLSAHSSKGTPTLVAFYDRGLRRQRGVPLVDRTKKELARLFGRPRPIREERWRRYGRRAVRSTGAGGGRTRVHHAHWIGRDGPIARYAKTATSRSVSLKAYGLRLRLFMARG